MTKTLCKAGSANSKMAGKGRVMNATYRTRDTCSTYCPFNQLQEDGTRKQTCYASTGPGGGAFWNAERNGTTTARAFDRLVREAKAGSMTRHLVAGELTMDYIREANRFHELRSDVDGYGYTHDWRELMPSWFEGWVVNASCETVGDVEEALSYGFMAVIESPAGHELAGARIAGRRVVTCPQQATDGKVTCASCNLCMTESDTRPIVEFVLHGAHKAVNTEAILNRRAA